MKTTEVKIKEVVIEQPDMIKMYQSIYAYKTIYDNEKRYFSFGLTTSLEAAESDIESLKKQMPNVQYTDYKIITFNLPNLNK